MIIVFVLFAGVAVLMIVKQVKKPKMSREMHFLNGADIESGYVSSDNNFFKGVSGDTDETTLIGMDHRTGKMRRYALSFVNLRTGRTDSVVLYDQLVIGRAPGDVGYTVDSDPSVSKQHCMIFNSEGKLYLMDMQSVNHTYLNFNRINQPEPLNNNDIIKIGNTQLEVRF